MENQEGSSYEGIFIIASIGIAFLLTYITKKQKESIIQQRKERKQMAKDIAELTEKLK